MTPEPTLSGLRAGCYLRKSRMEEGLDTGEVLRRHRESLQECAQRHGLAVVDWYPEVVSGESLYARPQMLRLLEDVEAGRFGAVLCMDLDRLSRGRMKDQGIILDAFRDSGTLIVTPEKVYDLSDEIDDELAEFKTFMSRREYKIINKRLRRGLRRSIQDGCYVANAPYGYRKAMAGRRPTLEVWEPEARFVRMMFALYAEGYGCTAIAGHVNALGARPRRSAAFSRNSVAKILQNPTYTGKIVWDQKTRVKKAGSAKPITIRNPPEKWTVTDGLHPPIITREDFDRVQEIMSDRRRPVRRDGGMKSPLSGLVRCAGCGGTLQRVVSKGEPYLVCLRKGCCAGAKLELVERRLLEHLGDTLEHLRLTAPDRAPDLSPLREALAAIGRETAAVQGQKARLHELLELGEYNLATYRERMAAVQAKLDGLERREAGVRARLEGAQRAKSTAKAAGIRTALDAYRACDAAGRNALLRAVLEAVIYRKAKRSSPAAFELECIPRSG